MRRRTLLVVLTVALCGCQNSGGPSGAALAPMEPSPSAASAIAGDLSARLAEQVPAKGTVLRVTADRSEFGLALEAALKGWGYSLNPENPAERTSRLDYVLEQSDGMFFASVTLPSVVLSRTYLVSATGAAPKSPLLVMRRE